MEASSDSMIDTKLIDSEVSTFIEEQAKSTSSYFQAWLDLITRLYGYSVYPLVTTNTDGKITGFLPLCSMQSPLTGRRLVSLPFTDLCPLLAVDESSTKALIDQAIHLANQQKAKYLELRSGTNDVLAKHSELAEGNLYVRWLMPLSTDPDSVWSNLRKPIQRQVKKSEKLGVKVRIVQQRNDVGHYYRLHLQTRCKKHGMPAQPQRYFFELWDMFAESGAMQLLLAEYEGAVIAGMILLASGTTIRYAYGASDERYLSLAPNDLLMWTSIKLGCSLGYQTFDMGRTACDNEGLMEFKRRWGAIQGPLPYYYYPHMAGLASTSETSWKYRLLTSSWKKLPLEIAGPLGGYLYKHLG
jgi:FemAB-related protein (PEP-CTERM system-associated)